ncbi:16395_t:CDS:2, partial [Gigaspora margarita]
HYTKESFIEKNGKAMSSCINCRTSISNTNQIKAKENNEKEIRQHQSFAYIQDQLVEVLSNFIDSYEDFDNAKPCSQVLHIDIFVFLNLFIDHIETSNKNEYDKLIIYQIVKLVSKPDEKPKKPKLKIMKNNEIQNLDYHNMNRVNPIPARFFKKIQHHEYYLFLRFTENYNNPFKNLLKNLFLSILDKPMTNSKSNQHNILNEKISNTTKLLTQENLLSQDDVLLPIDIFSQDDTIEDNELSNFIY